MRTQRLSRAEAKTTPRPPHGSPLSTKLRPSEEPRSHNRVTSRPIYLALLISQPLAKKESKLTIEMAQLRPPAFSPESPAQQKGRGLCTPSPQASAPHHQEGESRN